MNQTDFQKLKKIYSEINEQPIPDNIKSAQFQNKTGHKPNIFFMIRNYLKVKEQKTLWTMG